MPLKNIFSHIIKFFELALPRDNHYIRLCNRFFFFLPATAAQQCRGYSFRLAASSYCNNSQFKFRCAGSRSRDVKKAVGLVASTKLEWPLTADYKAPRARSLMEIVQIVRQGANLNDKLRMSQKALPS